VPLDVRHGPEKGFPGLPDNFLTIRPVTQITSRNTSILHPRRRRRQMQTTFEIDVCQQGLLRT
jgi:hypothetical protein